MKTRSQTFLKRRGFQIESHRMRNILFEKDAILEQAILNGKVDYALILLDKPEIIKKAHLKQNRALQLACGLGLEEIVVKLLKIKSVSFSVAASNNEALYQAILNNHVNLVQLLLMQPAVVLGDLKESIKCAFKGKNTEILQSFFGNPAILSRYDASKLIKFLIKILQIEAPSIALNLLEKKEIIEQVHDKENQVLLQAIKQGLVSVVARLLMFNNVIAEISNDILVTAVEHKQDVITEYLLNLPNIRDNSIKIRLAIQKAAFISNSSALEKLLSFPISRRAFYLWGNKVLLDVIKRNDENIFNVLFNWGPMQDEIPTKYYEYIDAAVSVNAFNIFTALFSLESSRNKLDPSNNKLLIKAIKNHAIEMSLMLCSLPVIERNLNRDGMETFYLAIEEGLYAVVEKLFSFEGVRSQMISDQYAALLKAIVLQRVDIVKLFLGCEEIKNAYNLTTPLVFEAAKGQNVDIFDMVFALPNLKWLASEYILTRNETLISAAKGGSLQILEKLLAIEDVRNTASLPKNLALLNAIENKHFDVVDRLLSLPQVKRAVSSEHIFKALSTGHYPTVAKLFEPNKMINSAILSQYLESVRIAAKKGHLKIIKLLLSDVTIRGCIHLDDNQILLEAIRNGREEILSLLLDIQTVQETFSGIDVILAAVNSKKVSLCKKLLTYSRVSDAVHDFDNEALYRAISSKSYEIVNLLLRFESVKRTLANPANDCLQKALDLDDQKMLGKLLAIEEITAHPTLQTAQLIEWALDFECLNVKLFKKILSIDSVRQQAHLGNNLIVIKASTLNFREAVRLLLEIPAVRNNAQVEDNALLYWAASRNDVEILLTLLKTKVIIEQSESWANSALREAWKNKALDTFKVLLDCYAVRRYLTKKLVRTFLSQDQKNLLSICEINKLLAALGRPIISKKNFRVDTDLKEIALKILDTPNSKTSTLIEAKKILNRYDNYLWHLKQDTDSYAELEGNSESSMDDELVRAAIYKLDLIQTEMEPDLLALGETLEDALEAVEQKIRSFLLDQLLILYPITDSDTNRLIHAFVTMNRDDLINAVPSAMRWAARYFNSTTDLAAIAWRCYDPTAPNPTWENYFVPPPEAEQDQLIFTTRAVSETALTFEKASSIVRKYAACIALLVWKEKNQDAEQDLIFYLAEIRRAHNNHTYEKDSPSCFPGTLSRLVQIAEKSNFLSSEIKEKRECLIRILDDQIKKAFVELLAETQSVLEEPGHLNDMKVLKCFEAITTLNHKNAWDFLKSRGTMPTGVLMKKYTQSHLAFRKKLIKKLKNGDNWDIFCLKVNTLFEAHRSDWFLEPLDRKFIQHYLSSFSPEACEKIKLHFAQAYPHLTGSLPEVMIPEEPKNPFEEELRCIEKRIADHPNLAPMFARRLSNLKIQVRCYQHFTEKFASEHHRDIIKEAVELLFEYFSSDLARIVCRTLDEWRACKGEDTLLFFHTKLQEQKNLFKDEVAKEKCCEALLKNNLLNQNQDIWRFLLQSSFDSPESSSPKMIG